jgi:hypothetical protein
MGKMDQVSEQARNQVTGQYRPGYSGNPFGRLSRAAKERCVLERTQQLTREDQIATELALIIECYQR